MFIKGCKTIEEFKTEEVRRIEKWINERFIKNSVTWERINAFQIKTTDKQGASMIVELKEID